MRLVQSLVLAVLLAGCALQPRPDTRADFPWDAPPERLRARHGDAPVIATAERQVFHDRFAGLPATIVYRYTDGGLTEVVVFNRSGHDDRTRYIDDFHRVSQRLRERYGQPGLEEMRWRNRLFAERPERWGDAISAGHLTYLARWRTPDARILMALRGQRYQVIHELVFRPPGG
ncbi:MAG: hypothetical protein U5K43_08830 [Halofilum sp. (in: g-proteobacteria)]|nr:hypothetical protein [Halofilum sp. (in: g-proteobacteria)]